MIKNNSFKFILFSFALFIFGFSKVSASQIGRYELGYLIDEYDIVANLFIDKQSYLCYDFNTTQSGKRIDTCYVSDSDIILTSYFDGFKFTNVDMYLYDSTEKTFIYSSHSNNVYFSSSSTGLNMTKNVYLDDTFSEPSFFLRCSNLGYSGFPKEHPYCTDVTDYTYINYHAGDKISTPYDYVNQPPVKYKVNYYFDNVLQENLIYEGSGSVGSTITIENKANEDYLDKGNNTYEVVLKDKDNEFNIYYFSKTYGTNYQQINTDNSQLWLPFSYDYLKSIFPNIDFSLWTSYEQFMFTLVFNILFVILLFLVLYVCYRLFLNIKGWFL